MQKENLFDLGIHSLDQFVASYMEYPEELLKKYRSFFNLPRFRTRETGISRRDISVWKKEGLLPNNVALESSWNEFSLTECIWLRLVAKLKKFGCDNNLIIEFKDIAFSQKAEDIKNVINSNLNNMVKVEGFDNPLQKIEEVIKDMADSELEIVLKKEHYSLFSNMIMPSCLFRMNIAILFFDDRFSFLNIGTPLNKAHEINVANTLKQLSTRSFIAINILELCSDFFENDQLHIDNNYYWGIMNLGERKVLDEIRNSKIKQVTIKVKDGSITHIKPMREDNENEEMIKKLSRLMKKGEYKQIELITRDGTIVKYEETDIIKMK